MNREEESAGHAPPDVAIDTGDKATEALEEGKYFEAIKLYKKAYQYLPEPKMTWEQASFFQAGIGDAYLELQDWNQARVALQLALKSVPLSNKPSANAYIHKQLGIACFELNDMDAARTHLALAFVAEGKDIFIEDDPKYLAYAKCLTKRRPEDVQKISIISKLKKVEK